MASSITMVCVPDVEDQLALVVPESVISRSSERGLLDPLVVTPLTAARNWTAAQSGVALNHGSIENVASSGCSTLRGFSGSPIGSPSYQFVRSSTSAGDLQPPPLPPPAAPLTVVSVMLVQSLEVLPWPTMRR